LDLTGPPWLYQVECHLRTVLGRDRFRSGWPIPQRTMWTVRIIVTSPAFHEDLGFVQRIEEFPIQQLISQFCSVIPNFRQTSAIPNPLPVSISIVRRCPMISSAVYRFRAMPLLSSAGILTPDPTWFIGGGSGGITTGGWSIVYSRYVTCLLMGYLSSL
jgi:hypothetical protein